MARSKYEYVNLGNYLFLTFLRTWANIARFFFFRKFKVLGKKNIPKDVPVLFTVNHQSAFLDPVLIGITCGRKPWYITRAGVFNGKWVKYILNAIHMLPIFRFRDKVNIVKANEDTFNQCQNILQGNGSILIFPEGNHGMRKKLRTPLRKGFARIALNAEASHNFQLGLKIIPTGIYYEHPMKSRTDGLVFYGKPFGISQYKDLFLKNENEAIKKLTEELESSMPKFMVDIPSIERYDEIENKWWHSRPKENNLAKRFNSDQQIIAALLENKEVLNHKKRNPSFKILWLIIGLPFFIYGLANNFLAFYFTKLTIKKTMKDPHFKQSIEFACGMALWPLLAVFQSGIFYLFFSNHILTLLYFISTPTLGVVAYDYYDLLIRGESYFKTSNYADLNS